MADTTTEDAADVNRGPEILWICGILITLSVITVALRFWVRQKLIRQLGWDDYCILAALIVLVIEMIIIVQEVRYGAGRHAQYIRPSSNIVKGLHLNFVTQPLCLIALCLTKLSVGLFLLRLTPSPRYGKFIWGTMGFTILSAAGNFLTVFFQCQPLVFTWDTSVPGGSCIAAGNLKFAAFFNSSVSVLTDLVFALLPVPMLWKVQMNWKIKSAVASVLALGIFATAAAVVKISFLSNYGKHGDFLFDSSDLTVWTTVEICTAIVAASIPCLKPLFRSMLSGSSTTKYNMRAARDYMRQDSSSHHVEPTTRRNDDFEMYDRTKVTVEAQSSRAETHLDNTSEESILHKTDARTIDIMRTTKVSVLASVEVTQYGDGMPTSWFQQIVERVVVAVVLTTNHSITPDASAAEIG